jgi:hypothetical protein
VQNLSQPMYVQRPEVPLPESAMLTPETHESAMNAVAAPPPPPMHPYGGSIGGPAGLARAGLQGLVTDPSGAAVPNAQVTLRNEETGQSQTTSTDAQGAYRFNNISPGNSGLFVQAMGFQRFNLSNVYLGVNRVNEINATLRLGSVSATVEVRAKAPQLETASADMVTTAERQVPDAEGKDVGDFFEYDLKEKVTIGKNQSALVPILQARINTERVTLWNEESNEPLRALWLNNTSGEEFDAGSFNILEDGTFAGEGMLAALRPGEKRLISYAADPAVRVRVENHPSEQPFSRIQIAKGTMTLTKEERESKTYTVSNSDKAARDVIIEQPLRPDWKLATGTIPEEKTPSLYRFRVKVQPKASAQLAVEEYHLLAGTVELSDISDDEVKLITEQNRMTPALQQAINRVLEQNQVIDAIDVQIKARQQEENSIASDQARIRENMKALKGSPEERALVQRYTQQLNSQEDRLAELHTQVASLQAKRQQEKDHLDQIIADISLDERF